jgi:hypothetical protein
MAICGGIWWFAIGCGRVGYVDTEPTPIDVAEPTAVAGAPYDVAPRFDGGGFVVLWTEVPLGSQDLVLRLAEFSEAGDRIVDLELGTIPTRRRLLRVFPRAEGWDVFHQEADQYQRRMDFARYDPSGEPILERQLSGVSNASVAATDRGYAIGYLDYTVTPLAATLQLFDDTLTLKNALVPEPPIADSQLGAQVGWTGEKVILAFPDNLAGGDVRLVVVDPATATVDSARWLLPGDGGQGIGRIVTVPSGGVALAVRHDGGAEVLVLDAQAESLWNNTVSIAPNRRESLDLALSANDSSVHVAIQTDYDTLPQIDLWTMNLIDGSDRLLQRVSNRNVSGCCPVVATSDANAGVVFEARGLEMYGPVLEVK